MENKTVAPIIDFSPEKFKFKKETVSHAIAEAFDSGNFDNIELALYLKSVGEGVLDALKIPAVQEIIRQEINNYGAEGKYGVTKYGKKVEYKPTYTNYDYSGCGHILLDRINDIIAELNVVKKDIENELKGMNQRWKEGEDIPTKHVVIEKMPTLVFEDYGEVIEIKAPHKVQSSGLKFTNF